MRSGITLAAIAAVCTALVAFTYQLTDERIAANGLKHRHMFKSSDAH